MRGVLQDFREGIPELLTMPGWLKVLCALGIAAAILTILMPTL